MLNSPLSASGGEAASALRLPSEFHTIYEVWFHEVARWVRLMGAPAAYREDLAQDVFIVVHRRLHEFDGVNLGGWLYQITRRRVRDFRQSLWFSRQLASSGIDPNACRDFSASPSETLETKRTWATLEDLLEELNEDERVALMLFEIEGFSGEEIATIQGVSIHTVFSRLRRARNKLKAALSERDSAPAPLAVKSRAARRRGTSEVTRAFSRAAHAFAAG
jgi:RNA polymerase sigma-70 factor (ECF subfamily)